MDIKPLTEEVAVSPQITADDMPALAQAGFRSIICNRPDGEAADQPAFAEIERAARAAGLDAAYVPVQPGTMSDETLAAFDAALARLPRPVLAYCRSGARSTALWSRHDAARAASAQPDRAGQTAPPG